MPDPFLIQIQAINQKDIENIKKLLRLFINLFTIITVNDYIRFQESIGSAAYIKIYSGGKIIYREEIKFYLSELAEMMGLPFTADRLYVECINLPKAPNIDSA